MSNFTSEYNAEVYRTSLWSVISRVLSDVGEKLYQSGDFTKFDMKALERIREILIESYKLSERQRRYHSRRLERLRKEYLNECEVINESCKHRGHGEVCVTRSVDVPGQRR